MGRESSLPLYSTFFLDGLNWKAISLTTEPFTVILPFQMACLTSDLEANSPVLERNWWSLIFTSFPQWLLTVFVLMRSCYNDSIQHSFVVLRSGRCRIRTRVDGFEARQDIQATLIALICPRCPPFLKKAEGLEGLWRAHCLVFQWGVLHAVARQLCLWQKQKHLFWHVELDWVLRTLLGEITASLRFWITKKRERAFFS